MENKNVIAAISLSAAVIILYSLFFQPDPEVVKKNLAKQNNGVSNTDTPSLEKNENFIKLSREEALKENDRVKFENDNIIGSISLKGATIDDLTFKDYNVELNGDESVKLLNPRNVDDGYIIFPNHLKANLIGYHGGITPKEMNVPVIEIMNYW